MTDVDRDWLAAQARKVGEDYIRMGHELGDPLGSPMLHNIGTSWLRFAENLLTDSEDE